MNVAQPVVPALPAPYQPAPDLAILHPEPFTPGGDYLFYLPPDGSAAHHAARRLVAAGIFVPDGVCWYRYQAPVEAHS